MSGAIAVRPVLAEEHEAVAALTVATYGPVLGPLLDDAYRAELSDVAHRAREAVVLVAVDPTGTLLGSITYVPQPESRYAEFSGADEAGLRMLVVAPDAQRRGLGTILVQEVIRRAREDGKTLLTLHTAPSMTSAQRLYERLGFRRAPDRDLPLDQATLLAYALEL